MTKRKRRVYSDQFKSDAVQLVTHGGRTFAEVSKQFELTESALRDWAKAAQQARPLDAAAPLTTSERAELVDLRKRLKRDVPRPYNPDSIRTFWIRVRNSKVQTRGEYQARLCRARIRLHVFMLRPSIADEAKRTDRWRCGCTCDARNPLRGNFLSPEVEAELPFPRTRSCQLRMRLAGRTVRRRRSG